MGRRKRLDAVSRRLRADTSARLDDRAFTDGLAGLARESGPSGAPVKRRLGLVAAVGTVLVLALAGASIAGVVRLPNPIERRLPDLPGQDSPPDDPPSDAPSPGQDDGSDPASPTDEPTSTPPRIRPAHHPGPGLVLATGAQSADGGSHASHASRADPHAAHSDPHADSAAHSDAHGAVTAHLLADSTADRGVVRARGGAGLMHGPGSPGRPGFPPLLHGHRSGAGLWPSLVPVVTPSLGGEP